MLSPGAAVNKERFRIWIYSVPAGRAHDMRLREKGRQ